MKKYAHKISYLMLLSTTVFAETNGVDITLSAVTELSDNAKRKFLESEKIEERQNKYIGGLYAHFNNEWMLLSSRYSTMRETFADNSQADYTTLEGDTKLAFGNPYQPFGLQLSHTRTSLLKTPDAIDLNENRDERTIIAIEPSYRWQLRNSNAFVVKASAMQASYNDDESKKAKRKGADIIWERGFSKVDKLQVMAQFNETTFDFSPDSNYRYESISALYKVQLNHLHYSLKLGQNRATPEVGADSVSKPSYAIEATYDSGNNSVSFSSEQRIDDASFGKARSTSERDPIAAKSAGLDLINLQSSELSWTTRALCDRCEFGLRAVFTKDEYENLVGKDNEEKGAGARISYKFSRSAVLSFDTSQFKRTFIGSTEVDNFDVNKSRIAFDYSLVRDLKLRLYAEREKRESKNVVKSYEENITGLSLSYAF